MTAKRLTEEQLKTWSELVNNPDSPVSYLGGDPGRSTGISMYTADFKLTALLVVHADDIVQFLELFNCVKKMILEDYKLFPNKMRSQIYSDMETPRVIGRIEGWAERKSVELVKQSPSIKPNGYAFIGKKPLPKSNPKNHSMDAHVHFMFWAIKNGKIDPKDLL